MDRIKKNAAFFLIGGTGYGIIELIWRGYTHWTMIIAGGVCFVIISKISKRFKNRPLVYKAVLSALGITAVELLFGIVFNKVLRMGIWDYSTMPFNFMGQICPFFTVAWCALGFIFVPLADILNRKIARG